MTEMGEGVSVDIVNDPNIDDLDDNHWLEVEYHYKSGKPVYGFFAATDGDGHTWRGRLNDQGGMCLAGLPDGDVEVELLPEEAVEEDDVRKLRDEIQAVLKEIIDDQEDQAEKHRRELEEQGSIQTTYTHVREVGRCAWQGGVAFIEFTGTVLNKTAEFVHYTSVANQLSNLLHASFKSYQDGELTWNEWLGSLSRNLTREQQEDVAQLIGVDPESVSPEGMSAAMGAVAEAYDIAAFIVDDEKSHEMLTQFAKELAGVQSSIDWACFSGAGIFEIVLAALLAATTAGAGYAAHAASQIRHTARLRTLGEKFRRLAALLRHKKQNKKLTAPVDERTSVTADQPDAIDIKAREPYTPHPDVAAPKAGDRIHKREHKDGVEGDRYTLEPDGKPLGAESGPIPNELLGMEDVPVSHDALVKEGWPTLDYGTDKTYATFIDAKPVDLEPGTKIYRVVDEKNNNAGGFWSYEMPRNKTEWRKGSAVKDSWNDNGYYVEHTVGEDGLKAWEGKAAGQPYDEFNGDEFYLDGGETQLFVTPNTVDTSSPKLTNWPEP